MRKRLNKTKQIKNYTKRLKQHLELTYSKRETCKIMNIISKNISTFFEENPSASFDDFETEFGAIDEIVPSILLETEFTQNSSYQWNYLALRKKMLKICTLVIILLALLIGSIYIKAYFDSQKSIPVYEKITIEEEY